MKNLTKLTSLVIIGLMIFSLGSCKTYIRLTETQSIGKDAVDNSVYENNDIKITYDMWSENGIMYFTLYNKTEKPLYIDWKRSVFIYNSWKNNYWVEKSTAEDFYVPVGTGKNISFQKRTSTVVQERYTFIPPKTYVAVPTSYYILGDVSQVDVKDENGKMKIMVTDLRHDKSATKEKVAKSTGKGTTKVWTKSYDAASSPHVFRNFLTYSKTENFANETNVENEFIVSKHTEMTTKNFLGKSTKVKAIKQKGKSKTKSKYKIYESPFRAGTSFYKTLTP